MIAARFFSRFALYSNMIFIRAQYCDQLPADKRVGIIVKVLPLIIDKHFFSDLT